MNEAHYMFTYWIMGAFTDDLETLTLIVGIIRSFESIGSCLAFGIGAAKVSPMVNLMVSFVVFAITVPSTSYLVLMVPERPSDGRKTTVSSISDHSSNDDGQQTVAVKGDARALMQDS